MASRKEFFYFKGNRDSRDHARAEIRTLLGMARDRCLIVDPYFSATDAIEYLPHVKAARLQTRVLSSVFFLRSSIKPGESKTQGDSLLLELNKLHSRDKTIETECKVLKGAKASPVHDRFLVIDSNVYLLGSSLNEFGLRATTLFRAPDPERLISSIESIWNDSSVSQDLKDWLDNRSDKQTCESNK